MKILVDIGHPAHVHLFKNIIWKLMEDGNKVKIAVRDKEITCYLLDSYGFRYEKIGKHKQGTIEKLIGLITKDYKLYRMARKFKPDVFLSHGSMYAAHVAKLSGKAHVSLEDTEESKEQYLLYSPFTDAIITPSCFKRDLGSKQVRYNGYKELAYLHPNYFKPDPSVLDDLGVSRNDKFIVLRFISWGASHDIRLSGVRRGTEIDFVRSLEEYGQVFITTEQSLGKKLDRYKITCPPEKMHSMLHYAQLYIGEGGTMATEAAILGTPPIHIESTSSGQATGELHGNFLELRDKYDLLYMFPDQRQALEKAVEILQNKNSKKEWRRKRGKLLLEKIDVTAWITDFIERYPDSFHEYRQVIIS